MTHFFNYAYMGIPRLLKTGLLLISLISASASAQDFQPLFANGLNGWTWVNSEPDSFVLNNGVLQVQGTQGWLRSPRQFGSFTLRGQFRFTEADSDSGIFVRVEPGTDFIFGWPGDAYQVQIREITNNQSDNPLPLANLYRHRVSDGTTDYERERVFALYTGVGQWQDIEIVVQSSKLIATLNGEKVLEADSLENATGFIGFQSEKGQIEYRNLMIYEHE